MPYESQQLTLDQEKLSPTGIYSYLRSIDASVQEVKDGLYDHERESGMRLRKLEEESTSIRKEITDIKITLGVMEHRQNETAGKLDGVIETVHELKSDVKALNAKVDTLQSKLGLYISLLGIGLSVVLVIFQQLMK